MSFRIPSTSPDYNAMAANQGAVDNFDTAFGVAHYTTAGAITQKEGLVTIDGTSTLAMTLAAPTAGLPSAGGDDGRELIILSTTAHAHTVTTPANKINSADDTITFSGTLPNYQVLVANNGIWQTLGSAGVTLSEV